MYIKKREILAAVLLLFLFGLCVPVQACTVFTQKNGNTVLAGSNEDWMYSCGSFMVVTAPQKESYGRVCFYNSSYVQGGMNERGLFYDGASCPNSKVPQINGKYQLGMDLGEQVLSKCADVEEVINMLNESNVPSSFCDHLLFADASGKSAIFEWMQGRLNIIRNEQSYQLITNFWLTDKSLGNYPCNRFSTAEAMLKKLNPSIEGFADILNATKQNWGQGGTLYSNIYDLKNRMVYVFCSGKLDSACKIDLNQRLNTMKTGDSVKEPIKELTYDVPIVISANKETAASSTIPAVSSAAASNQKSQPASSAISSAPVSTPTMQSFRAAMIFAGIILLVALILIGIRNKIL